MSELRKYVANKLILLQERFNDFDSEAFVVRLAKRGERHCLEEQTYSIQKKLGCDRIALTMTSSPISAPRARRLDLTFRRDVNVALIVDLIKSNSS